MVLICCKHGFLCCLFVCYFSPRGFSFSVKDEVLMLGSIFLQAESAIAALNCSGVVLGSLPIRLVL